jgi:hypothetical protein
MVSWSRLRRGVATLLAEGGPTQAGTGSGQQDPPTRSEEELRVGKQSAKAGTARLRKYVETEPETYSAGVEVP